MTDQRYSLRYVTDTLLSAQKDQLPRLIPALTTHLANCSEILCSKAQYTQATTLSSGLVHQLRTQISSLLQDKNPQGRWAAVVLIKVTTESVIHHQEGWDFLRASTAWVRGLLAVLGKPDPSATKTMALLLLTRIFLLTHGQASLTREITTPHLASFVTACLNLVTKKATPSGARVPDLSCGYLEIVLQCFIRLLPNHPAIFRTFSSQIRLLISPLIAATPSDLTIDAGVGNIPLNEKVSTLARCLHAVLPLCAMKNGASEEWSKNILLIIKQTNRTMDKAFRAVQNNRTQSNGSLNGLEEASQEPVDHIGDDLMLPPWHGVSAGCERIQGLLSLLSVYLATKGNMNYSVPVKAIYETAGWLLSTTQPPITASENNAEEVNRSIAREERERLYMMLPQIHIATFQVLSKLISRMSAISFSISTDLMDQIIWTIQRSSSDKTLRSAAYKLMDRITEMIGTSISPQKSASINFLVQMACRDLVAEYEQPVDSISSTGQNGAKTQYNADSFLSTTSLVSKTARIPQDYQDSALKFLCTALLHVPASSFISSVRSRIDKVAVLLQHEELQLTSVLNPNLDPRYKDTNLVPFFAKFKRPSVEALIHRRRGAVTSGQETQESDDFRLETTRVDIRSTFQDTAQNTSGTDTSRVEETQARTELISHTDKTRSSPTKRNVEEVVSGVPTAEPIEIEHTAKRLRLQDHTQHDLQADETLDETSQMELDPEVSQAIEGNNAAKVENVTLDSGSVASNDSFEIPEIFVDSEGDDSEAEEQD